MEKTLRQIHADDYAQKRIARASAARQAKELRKAGPRRRLLSFRRRAAAPQALTPLPR